MRTDNTEEASTIGEQALQRDLHRDYSPDLNGAVLCLRPLPMPLAGPAAKRKRSTASVAFCLEPPVQVKIYRLAPKRLSSGLHSEELTAGATLVRGGATRDPTFSAAAVRGARRVQLGVTKEDSMGDRGGKKDKKKNQQQLATKQKHKEQKRLDKAPSKPLAVNS